MKFINSLTIKISVGILSSLFLQCTQPETQTKHDVVPGTLVSKTITGECTEPKAPAWVGNSVFYQIYPQKLSQPSYLYKLICNFYQ